MKNKASGNKAATATAAPKKPRLKIADRINTLELGFAAFLFVTGVYDFFYGKYYFYVYLILQAITFTIVGFGYVGTIV